MTNNNDILQWLEVNLQTKNGVHPHNDKSLWTFFHRILSSILCVKRLVLSCDVKKYISYQNIIINTQYSQYMT